MIPPFSCSSQFAYSESPPLYWRRSLDLLWAVWSQFRIISSLGPACTSSQSLQLPLKHRESGYSWEFKPLPLYLLGWFPLLSFAHTALGVLLCLWACHCLWVSLPCLLSSQTQGGESSQLIQTHFLCSAGESAGFSRHHWVCGESSLWLGRSGVATVLGRLCTSPRELALCFGTLGSAKLPGLPAWTCGMLAQSETNCVLPQLVLDCESLGQVKQLRFAGSDSQLLIAWWHLWYPSQHYPAFCLWYSCLPHHSWGCITQLAYCSSALTRVETFVLWASAALEPSCRNDVLFLWWTQGFPWSAFTVLYQPPQGIFMLFKPRALPEDQPLESDLLHPDPTCCGWTWACEPLLG